jgi:hypothetical protein
MTTALIAILVAAGPVELHLDPVARQTVSFTVHHPLHNIRGVTHEVEGKARAYSDGTIEVEVRAALQSFRTGSMAINEDFLELMGAARFPDVTVRAIVPPEAEQQPGTTVDAETTVKIDLHGKTRMFPAGVKIARGPGGHVTATGHFVVELHDFGVETPRYMYIDASPTIQVGFELAWLTEQVSAQRLLMSFESAAGAGGSSGGSSDAGSMSGGQDAGAADAGSVGDAGSSGGTTGGTSSGGSTSGGESGSSSGAGSTSGGSAGDGGTSDGGLSGGSAGTSP